MRQYFTPVYRRLYSRSSSVSSSSLDSWIDRLVSRPAVTSTDYLDVVRAAQLQRSLPTRQVIGFSQLSIGDELPKGHHLIYFQPKTMLNDLAEDGSSPVSGPGRAGIKYLLIPRQEYNAPEPYFRRMWAGGSIVWNTSSTSRPLILGSTVAQKISIPKAELKSGMLFVHQQLDLFPANENGEVEDEWALREIRTHVFREEVQAQNKRVQARPKDTLDFPPHSFTFSFTPSPALLFRYSALTFNGHRIHYDLEWTRTVEGHPDLVFHGPLTATLLMELAQSAGLETHKRMERFDYRATSPMYTSREIRLVRYWEGPTLHLRAEQGGRIGMKATAGFVE